MEVLVQVLYWLTTTLLVPVVLSLLALLAWSLLELGGFLRELRERRRDAPRWSGFEDGLREGTRKAQSFFEEVGFTGFLSLFAARGRPFFDRPAHLAKLVSDLEIAADAKLARMSFGLRLGPMLGLMGTLIPMGPALLGLSAGRVEVMAQNLVVAFATTVVGLLVGGICYTMLLVRRRWYAGDLTAVAYLEHLLHEGEEV